MPKILIDILPAMGHFNSLLKIVQLLKDAGYEVIYINQGLKAELAKYNLQSRETAFDISPVLLKKERLNFRKYLHKRIFPEKDKKLKKMREDFLAFKEFLITLSPDLVLLDEQNMLKAIYYEICNVPVLCVESKPEPYKSPNVPPFTSYYVPSDSFRSKCLINWLWMKKTIRNRFRLKMLQLNSDGNDIYSITCQIAKNHGIKLSKRINLERGYGIGINKIQRLIVSAVDFDFPHPDKEDTYSIGPLVDIHRESNISLPRYRVLIDTINRQKEKNEGVIIYCSLGSDNLQFHNEVLKFFNRIKQVSSLNPKDLFILSTGFEFNVTEIYPVPNNMYVFDFLPQVDLLKYCDIMITHGGINSITECVFFGVPTLNYPLSMDWDQPGCAARAVYHKIGLMGKINKDNAKTISRKLNSIKSDYSFYKMNILTMKKKFEEKNNSDHVIEIIERIIKQHSKPNGNN
ncbi:MAG: glycosyltransferase [Bacteroidales bacterium]